LEADRTPRQNSLAPFGWGAGRLSRAAGTRRHCRPRGFTS